jgi:hypothetical protein
MFRVYELIKICERDPIRMGSTVVGMQGRDAGLVCAWLRVFIIDQADG